MKKIYLLLIFMLSLIYTLELENTTENEWCIDRGHQCRRWWYKKCCHPYRCIHGRCRKPYWWDEDNDNNNGDHDWN